jgi:hypothetical protein
LTVAPRRKAPKDDTPAVLKEEPKVAKKLDPDEEAAPAAQDVDRTKPGDARTPAPRPTTEFNFYDTEANKARNRSLATVIEPTARRALLEDARVERVIATRPGYYGHKVREEGEVFDMYLSEKGFLPSWTRLATEKEIETRFVPDTDDEGNEIPQVKGKRVPILNNARSVAEGGNMVRPQTTGGARLSTSPAERSDRPRI